MSYRLEYAKLGTAGCKGPKPCGKENKIPKGSLRLGTLVTINGHSSFAWRHWGCTTEKQFANMKESFETADELDGFEDLRSEDQERVRVAFEKGHVAEEDIPESARKPDTEGESGEDEPKPKKGGKKAKKDEDDEDDKPKKKGPAKKKAPAKKAKKAASDEDEEEEAVETDEDDKPKKAKKKAPAKAKKRKADDDDEEEAEKPKKKPVKKPAAKKSKKKAEEEDEDDE